MILLMTVPSLVVVTATLRLDDEAAIRTRPRTATANYGPVRARWASSKAARSSSASVDARGPGLCPRGAAGRGEWLRPEPAGPPDDLTEREVETLRLIALGHTNSEIAGQLY
jgi:two-component system response regulator NreC